MADRFEDLRTFVAIVDHGGVNAAAAAMGIARSAASRRLSDMEARIGVTLIERTTRRFEPTSAGRSYLARARVLLASIDELDGGFAGAFGESMISVSADDPLVFAAVLPAICAFLEANADAAVSLMIDADGGVDSDVHLSALGDGPTVGSARRMVCASPGYLARKGRPMASEGLDGHVAISTPDDLDRWRRTAGTARPTVVLAATDDATALAAALVGIGLAVLPETTLAPHVARGELEILLADASPPAQPIRAALGGNAPAAATLLLDSLRRAARD